MKLQKMLYSKLKSKSQFSFFTHMDCMYLSGGIANDFTPLPLCMPYKSLKQ